MPWNPCPDCKVGADAIVPCQMCRPLVDPHWPEYAGCEFVIRLDKRQRFIDPATQLCHEAAIAAHEAQLRQWKIAEERQRRAALEAQEARWREARREERRRQYEREEATRIYIADATERRIGPVLGHLPSWVERLLVDTPFSDMMPTPFHLDVIEGRIGELKKAQGRYRASRAAI